MRTARLVKRIATVDRDVHHGNGAQKISCAAPDVLTISIHQDKFYPLDSGRIEENGEGTGLGACINIALPGGTGHDGHLGAIARVAGPALDRFRPEIIIVPSGFDAFALDPPGRMQCSSET